MSLAHLLSEPATPIVLCAAAAPAWLAATAVVSPLLGYIHGRSAPSDDRILALPPKTGER